MRAHGTSNEQPALRGVYTKFEMLVIDVGPHFIGCFVVLDVACDIGSVFVNVWSEVINAEA